MLGQKERDFQPCVVCLEALVPTDNFYRQVEAKLDLTFVRDLVQRLYKPCGRPGIDPVVFFKLQLIMFFEGIRSERQLMTMVNMRLDHRWYLGYDLNEAIPHHSSLTYIRDRFGLEVFQRFFERIVELCIEAGLVWGKELYFDGTKVRANASLDSSVPRWYWLAKEHLEALFDDDDPQPHTDDRHFVTKYNGTRLPGRRKYPYSRVADQRTNLTDPDATPMKRNNGDVLKLGYHTHYVVDGGKARIILAALVTPASIMDNTPMLDLARWARFRWQLDAEIAVADATYGTAANIMGLEQDGLRAYTPVREVVHRNSAFYTTEAFHYDADRDVYICPQGQTLTRWAYRPSDQAVGYRAAAEDCNACPVKAVCTTSSEGRTITRPFAQPYLERVKGYYETEAYRKAMRKRKVWIEPKFGELKQWHQGDKFRLRRLRKVNIEGLLKAAGQNIKQLLKAKTRKNRPKPPANTAAIRAVPALFPANLCV